MSRRAHMILLSFGEQKCYLGGEAIIMTSHGLSTLLKILLLKILILKYIKFYLHFERKSYRKHRNTKGRIGEHFF